MKYFFDTEFIEEPGYLELISIGMVSEDSRGIYLLSEEFDPDRANDWVKENVFEPIVRVTEMPLEDTQQLYGFTKAEIAAQILDFIGCDRDPEFWAYFADYDWVIFCWLFGRMIDLPEFFPKFCMDLKQLMVDRGVTRDDLPEQENEHNALADAAWVKKAYKVITEKEQA